MVSEKELINAAIEASKKACAPYSNFHVGAALLTKDGRIYKGFNVENDGLQSICGERTAFIKAITEGNKEFQAIAIAGKDIRSNHFDSIVPCGYCRQFMREYTKDGFTVICYDGKSDKIDIFKIEDLLPNSFRKE